MCDGVHSFETFCELQNLLLIYKLCSGRQSAEPAVVHRRFQDAMVEPDPAQNAAPAVFCGGDRQSNRIKLVFENLADCVKSQTERILAWRWMR
jgi:hypothetical protein